MLTETELKAELGITKLQAIKIKRFLADGGASYQKSSAEPVSQPAGALAPAPNAAVPFAEAPDLADRTGLRATSGTFQRLAVGVPAAEAPVALVLDARTVQKYGETVELIARLDAEQVRVAAVLRQGGEMERMTRTIWQVMGRLPGARERLASLDKSIKAEQAKYKELSAALSEKKEKAEEVGASEGQMRPGVFTF